MRHSSRVLALFAAIMLASGCTHAAEQQSAPPLPEIDASTSDVNLAAKLLSETDLPPGYTETELPNVKGGVGELIGCSALNVQSSTGEGEATVAFRGTAAGSLISETVRLSPPSESTRIVAELRTLPQKCPNAKTAGIAGLGTETASIQLTADRAELGVKVDGYIIAIRDDQVFVVVVVVSPDQADPAVAESVAKTAWEKATR